MCGGVVKLNRNNIQIYTIKFNHMLEVGKKYTLVNIQQHIDCQGCDRCTVLILMEKGFFTGEYVEIEQRIGTLIAIKVGTSIFAVREENLECCTFEEIE